MATMTRFSRRHCSHPGDIRVPARLADDIRDRARTDHVPAGELERIGRGIATVVRDRERPRTLAIDEIANGDRRCTELGR